MSPFEKPEKTSWLKLPKVGESYDYSSHGAIKEIKKVENAKKGFNFTRKEPILDMGGNPVIGQNGTPVVGTADLGYRYVVTFADGKAFSMSDWGSYYAFTDADVKEGDVIKINHPIKGTWGVEKLGV